MLDRLYENLSKSELALRDPKIDREQAQQLWWRIISRTRRELRVRREAISPALLESHGLKGAILGCPALIALHEAGVAVHTHLVDDVASVSPATQYAAYQIIHGSLSGILNRHATRCVTLRVRTGHQGAKDWLAIRISVSWPPGTDDSSISEDESLLPLQELANAYGGSMHCRNRRGRHFVSALLYDQSIEQLLAEDELAHSIRA